MKNAVKIEINGEPGQRYSVSCKACKSKWTEEVTLSAIFAKGHNEIIGLGHSCPKVDGWKKVHPFAIVSASAFRFDVVRWGKRSDGSVTKCGGRCLHAKGGDCDCQCGGRNHGHGSAA